jgi:hypothetical protein
MLGGVRAAGGSPSGAYESHFHIAFLQRFLMYAAAERQGISPNDSDVTNGVAGAMETLMKKHFIGSEEAFRSAISDISGKQSAEQVVDIIVRTMRGDEASQIELEKMLQPRSKEFHKWAGSAGIDTSDIVARAIAEFFTMPLCNG